MLAGAKFTDYDTTQLMRCTELRTAKGEPYVILPGFEDVRLLIFVNRFALLRNMDFTLLIIVGLPIRLLIELIYAADI